jgi:hypothetical protein
MIILLMVIRGYWCLLIAIDRYSIVGYLCLLMTTILMTIDDYSIGDYCSINLT